MAPAAKRSSSTSRSTIVASISTPLGFYVLVLLIIEGTLSIVLSCSKLTEDHVWDGFICMLAIFGVVIVFVTILVFWFPRNLLFGKEEHANAPLDSAALEDQIEQLIAKNVKAECLKKP